MNAIHSSQQQQMEIEPFRQTHLLSHQQKQQQQQSQQTDNQANEMGIFEPVSNQMQVNGIDEVSKQHNLIPNLMDMNGLHHQHAHSHNQTNQHPYHTTHLESQQPHYATRHAQQQQQQQQQSQQPQLLQLHAASQQQHNNTSNNIGTNSSAINMHLSASLTTSGAINCLTPPQQAQVQPGTGEEQASAPKSTSCEDTDDLADANLLTDNHSSNANNQQELTGAPGNSSSSGSQRRANIDGIAADDPVVLWLLDNYEMADGDSLPRSTVYDHYMAFCKEVNLTHVNAASFGKLIRSVFAGLKTRRLGTRGHSKYHYYGIKVKFDSSAHHMLQQMAAAGANNDQNEGSIQNSDASESDSIIESQQHSNNNSSSTNNNTAGQQASTGKRAKRAHTMSSANKRYCNQQSDINHYKTNFDANNFHSQPQLHQLSHTHGTNQLQHLYGSHLHQQPASHGVETHELANMIPMANHALDVSISDPQYAQLNQQHGQLIQHPHYQQQQHQLEQHLQLQIMQEPTGHVGYVSTQASGESSIPVDQQHLTYIHSHHNNNQQPQHPHQQQSHHQQHHISGHTHHSLSGDNQPLNQAHHQQLQQQQQQQQHQQQQQQHQLYQQQPHHQHYQQQQQHNQHQPSQQHLATNYSNRVQQFELESLRAYLDQNTTPEQLISNCWPSEPLIEQKFIVELAQTSGLSVGCLQILEMRYKSHWQRIVELLAELKFAHVEQVLLDFWHPTCEWRQSNLESESAASCNEANKLDNNNTNTSQPQEELQEASAGHQAVSSQSQSKSKPQSQSQSQFQTHSQCHSNENTNADISTCLGDSSPKANKTSGTLSDVSPQYATNSLQNENSLTFQTLFQLTTSSKKLVDWILRVDNSMYTSLKNFLVPDALNPMPAPLRQSIKDFAKNLSTWTQSSLKDYEQSFVFNKLKLSESFGSTLCRCASLNHLAKAARAVWQQQAMLEQMSIDLSLLDLRDIEHQVELMVSNSSAIDVSDNNDDGQGDEIHLNNANPTKHNNTDGDEKDEETAHAGDNYDEKVETNDNSVEDKVDSKKRQIASQPNKSISSNAPAKSISPSQLVDKLLQLLNSPSPETSWPNWCRDLVDSSSSSTSLTQPATNTSSVSSSQANSLTLLQDEAQLFILNFNFQISLIGKELTLRSAPSLSSYVLISMLFDEYIYYLVASKLASAAEVQAATNTNKRV